MDNSLEKKYEEALHKSLDALLMGASALALITGSATLKSSSNQPQDRSLLLTSQCSSQLGATYKKRSQVYLDTGEERTVVETYKLSQHGQWEITDIEVEDVVET